MRAWIIVIVLLMVPDVAHGRSDETFRYPLSRVWTSAVRLMRIDLGCPITEKDRKDGYVLFDYTSSTGKIHQGSIQVFEIKRNGRKEIKVILQIENTPSYIELMLLGKLRKKMKLDFGPPPRLKPIPPTGATGLHDRGSTGGEQTADANKGDEPENDDAKADKSQ